MRDVVKTVMRRGAAGGQQMSYFILVNFNLYTYIYVVYNFEQSH